MAPKIKNQAQIAAVQQANAIAQANAAAAQARAAAADAARKPVLKQTVAGIGGINKAVQAAMDAINNPKSSQAQIDKALAESKKALAANKANLATITPEQRQMAVEQGQIYTQSMSDVEKYNAMISGVPEAIFEQEQAGEDKSVRDAFAILTSTFALYGLDELSPVIEGFMKQGLTSNEAIIELRKNKVYQTRFAGNTTRTAAGLNALSEGEYLALEDSYSETLRAYGQQALLGTDKKARQARMATIIGADISPVEFKDRVSTVVTRVENADPLVKSTLRDFYKITDTDLVSYFLNPTENLPKLQEKVTAAEIGSAALAQGGLTTDMTSAESLAKFGVDLATARKGYSTISEVLPTATKLSQIYNEENIQYNQKVAEEEVFKGLASAQRKRTQLAEKEIASFQGSSGVGAAGLSTTYLRKGSAAGQF
jgi:uncharacterized protein YoaH (UPF0181 family)